MQLNSTKSELESFWQDQNQKLIAKDGFLSDRGDLFDDSLYFKHPSGASKQELDFSVFELPHLKIKHAATLTLSGNSHPLSLKEYAKLAVVNAITPKSIKNARIAYMMMVHLGGFLNAQESGLLSSNNIEAFHLSYLTQSINKRGYFTRLAPEAYNGSYGCFNFVISRNLLQSLGIEGLVENSLTRQNIDSTLDSTSQAVMGIRLSEYKEGGSFNFLTLELGQYYVDHMKRIYEKDHFYVLVCQQAINSVSQQFDLESIKESQTKNRWKNVLLDTIQGTFVPNKIARTNLLITRDKLHIAMVPALFNQYQCHFEKVQSLLEQNIHQVVKGLGLEMRFDAVEVIRILMLQKHYPFTTHKSPKAVWKGYISSLDKTYIDSHLLNEVTVADVFTRMSEVVSKNRLNKTSFMSELAKWSAVLMCGKKAEYMSELEGEFERVSDAMTSLIVAWLGYRKSEFGYPLSAIGVEPNLDILDNSYVPFRFKLKWLVPKTNGKTKIDREITSQCYQIASQLNELFQLPEGSPCLYMGRGNHKAKPTSNKSGVYIDSRVKSNWESFVTHYQPFVDANELQRLSQLEVSTLSSDEEGKLQRLSAIYDLSSARFKNLLDTSREVRRDIVKLNCTRLCGNAQKLFKESLMEYIKTGDISNPKHKALVGEYLSDETREWLSSDGVNLDQKGMADITRELLQDVRYPVSHAFRHIWAEAVLTRYQGDVGAVIRHQFCHMDESFFMAYLRNKEPQDLVRAARIKVLNSIVDTLIVDSKQIGREYLGGFSRYVKKAASLTKVITSSEMLELRERIAERVISIQPSHFATCITREGSESRAKCSTFGDMNPQNAKPAFCLNCTNALITEGNLKGIWLTIQPFVKESLNEHVMGFMVEQNLPTLRSGFKRIKELQTEKNSGNVSKILQVINKAIQSIETKLKEEGGLNA